MDPSPSRQQALAHPAPTSDAIPLRLTAARGGVGIELSEPLQVGPLRVVQLEWTLPGLQFPLDLSGGVREFRHRRGALQAALFELDPDWLGRWLSLRAKELLGGLDRAVAVWPNAHGFGVGFSGADGCVAFELVWAPSAGAARFIIDQPRTAGSLRGPSISHVLLTVDRVLGKLARRRGRILELGDVCTELVRSVLPPLGVRVPKVTGLWLSAWRVDGERFEVAARCTAGSAELPGVALAALDFAELVQDADELLLAGDADGARAGYMSALERAPRHPELCRTIASIDKDFEERFEAALGLLVEALPATHFGLVGAELLLAVGDESGAEMAIRRGADAERFAPLAALLWVRFAELCESAERREQALDAALGCCPSSDAARWARLRSRLFTGDVNGALSDAEHLEAAARGSAAKHEVIMQAARELLLHGQSRPARRLFERALRYLPSDADATFGLARCFLEAGSTRRALVLLGRAAELVDDGSPLYPEIQLELAKALASHAGDLPQAIARAQRVAGRSKVLVEARALEARWRAQLGDIAGAAIAFGRLKDSIELLEQRSKEFVPWLLEAANFFQAQGDDRIAERQLSLALRIAPRNHEVLARYRSVAARLGHKPLPKSRGEHGETGAKAAATVATRDAAARGDWKQRPEQAESAPTSQVEEIASGRLGGEAPISSVPPTQGPAHPRAVAVTGSQGPSELGFEEIGLGDAGGQDVAAISGESTPAERSAEVRGVEETTASDWAGEAPDTGLELEAEELMRRLMTGGALSPNQYKSLSDALTRLGRDDELHAAGWGLFEDADGELRRVVARELVPLLERLLARSDDETSRALYAAQLKQVRGALD